MRSFDDLATMLGCCFLGVSDFKKLEVWRKSHALALNVHRAAKAIRERDCFALRSQMLRAAMSIPANIVEGSGKNSSREFVRFLRIALGSATELEYHLIAARDVAVISRSDFESLSLQTIQVRRMLFGLTRYLNSTSRSDREK
jgi:four helix bundle protein